MWAGLLTAMSNGGLDGFEQLKVGQRPAVQSDADLGTNGATNLDELRIYWPLAPGCWQSAPAADFASLGETDTDRRERHVNVTET
jgi:hypothetical protein